LNCALLRQQRGQFVGQLGVVRADFRQARWALIRIELKQLIQ